MMTLIDELELLIRSSSKLRTKRHIADGDTTVCVQGQNGTAEVDFRNDGTVVGLIDAELIHSWEAFPVLGDIKACARKICELLD